MKYPGKYITKYFVKYRHSKIPFTNIFQSKCNQNNTTHFVEIFHQLFHKNYIIFHTIYLVLYLNISHISCMFFISFNYVTYCTIFTMFHNFLKIFSENVLWDTAHWFFKMAALQKFWFAVSYASLADSHSYNTHCYQSKSILTDSLLIASKLFNFQICHCHVRYSSALGQRDRS